MRVARRKYAAVGAALGLALTLVACSSSGSSSAAKSGNSAEPYAGQTITYETYTATPEFTYYKTLMPQFTAKTGIKVNFVELPVSSIDQTLQLQLKSKDTGLDVFSYGTEDLPNFVAAGAAITFTAVRNGYNTHSCVRLQRFTRSRRTAALHN